MKLNGVFKGIGKGILSLFYPEKCIFCNGFFETESLDHGVCQLCKSKLVYLANPCLTNLVEQFQDGPDSLFCAVRYVGTVKRAIVGLKYSGKSYVSGPLAWIMFETLAPIFDFNKYDFLCPVPTSKTKIRERGYNQADLLAKDFSIYCGMKHIPDILARTKDLPSQSLLNMEARLINVRNSFAVNKPELVQGKSILIIDDVLTTGATIIECAAQLKTAGAYHVTAVALATGKRNV